MRAARFVGHYINVLGTASVLWMIVSPILGFPLHIDLGFIFSFWIGLSLLEGRPWSRKVALIFSALGFLFTVGYLVSLLWATGPVSGPGNTLRTPLLASIHGGIILLLVLPPLILLLLPGTRRWFAEQGQGPTTRYWLTSRVIVVYLLAACVPIAAGVGLDRSTRTVRPSSSCGGVSYGERKIGAVSAGWMEDEETGRPVCISWLAFAESDSVGSPRDGHVPFGPHRISVPELKAVRYLISPPSLDTPHGNVLLVREDGTVIRLPRRVTPEQFESARDAGHGVRDFEELRVRLESLLPSVATGLEKE